VGVFVCFFAGFWVGCGGLGGCVLVAVVVVDCYFLFCGCFWGFWVCFGLSEIVFGRCVWDVYVLIIKFLSYFGFNVSQPRIVE